MADLLQEVGVAQNDAGEVEGAVIDAPRRHSGTRLLYFLELCAPAGAGDGPTQAGDTHHVLCKGRSYGGDLDDATTLRLRRELRPGDRLRVRYARSEWVLPRGASAEGEKVLLLLHACEARITALSVVSNTGTARRLIAAGEGDGEGEGEGDDGAMVVGKEAAGWGGADDNDCGADDGFGEEEATSGADGRHVFSEARFGVFADWLDAEFGAQLRACQASNSEMRRVGAVLDVGGGKGELSLLLALRGLRAVVVDPREHAGMLSRRQRKQLRRSGSEGFETERCYFGRGAEGGGAVEAMTTVDEISAEMTTKLLADAGMVVGLHPDEATEAIMCLAIKNRLPFAIAPCCVFSRIFGARRHRGRAVRTHAQLCDYLQAQAVGTRRVTLPFDGQNTIIYHLGDYPPADLHPPEQPLCKPCVER